MKGICKFALGGLIMASGVWRGVALWLCAPGGVLRCPGGVLGCLGVASCLDIYRGVVKGSCRAQVERPCGGARRERHLVANRETLPAGPFVTAGPCSLKSNAPLHRPPREGKCRGKKSDMERNKVTKKKKAKVRIR